VTGIAEGKPVLTSMLFWQRKNWSVLYAFGLFPWDLNTSVKPGVPTVAVTF
jgi:hypothetical protein